VRQDDGLAGLRVRIARVVLDHDLALAEN